MDKAIKIILSEQQRKHREDMLRTYVECDMRLANYLGPLHPVRAELHRVTYAVKQELENSDGF